ncbi:hypothetical protein L1856_07570 [Streptomyces sp. Tue 6430]|nr:hypothetical protein [Streptomyces sp. Tue 6430]
MSDFEHSSAEHEARHTTPGRAWTPEETLRQDLLRRCLGAVAGAASARSAERAGPPHGPVRPAACPDP